MIQSGFFFNYHYHTENKKTSVHIPVIYQNKYHTLHSEQFEACVMKKGPTVLTRHLKHIAGAAHSSKLFRVVMRKQA